MRPLTSRQEAFCQYYAKGMSGADAARRAGYAEKTARSQAGRLLSKDDIRARIAELMRGTVKRCNIDLDRVTQELQAVAFSDMKSFARWTDSGVVLVASNELKPEQSAAVEYVAETTSRDGTLQVRIKLHSKLRALEALIRCFELLDLQGRLEALEEGVKPHDE